MSATTVSVEVKRAPAEVYAYTTDPSRFSEWQQQVVSGRLEPATTNGPARCVTVRKIGLVQRTSTSDVVEDDPPRAWRVRGIDGPVRASVDVEVEPMGEQRSRVTIVVDFRGHGVGRLLVPLVVRRQARNEMPANLAALKERLEGRS